MSQEQKNRVIVIGAGPAGLTAAYELCKAGMASIIFEKEGTVGGLSKTINFNGYHFDIGGHRFFTKIKAVYEIWHEVLEGNFLRRNRLSRIYYENRFFHYPLRPFNAFLGFGIGKSILIMTSYLWAQLLPQKPEKTVEQWVTNRFGKRLYKTFFKSFTEKIWGMPCCEISAEWAAQRIPGLSLFSAIKNAILGSNLCKGQKTIKTLIDTFDYPQKGPGMMWEAVADIVLRRGCQIRIGAEVEKVFWNHRGVYALEIKADGHREIIEGNHFISSMPLGELVQKLEPAVPFEIQTAGLNLKYRDFITVALLVNKPDVSPDNWIYIHDPEVKVGRIQNYKNWSPYMVPDLDKTCLGLEYFCFEGDELWNMADSELIEFAKGELETLNLVRACDVYDGTVVRMPKAYPVYDHNSTKSIQVLRRFLDKIDNLQVVGRNGMHKYNNQDHSMLTAMMAVENICGANHNLWKVNTDPEYH